MYQHKSISSLSKNANLATNLLFGVCAILAVGCSGVSTSYKVAASGTTLDTSGSSGSTLTTGTSNTSTTTTTTTTGASSPYTFTVRGVGYSTTTVSVSAGQVLKVKFAPGVQDTAISGTGVYPQYSQLGVYLQVGASLEPTEMLQNGFDGSTAQTSTVMDFSSSIPSGCQGSTTCRQNVTITITKPNNDFYCLNEGIYCPWNQVLNGQPWNGKLTVQTDDTDSI
jgi:hypothetical protein